MFSTGAKPTQTRRLRHLIIAGLAVALIAACSSPPPVPTVNNVSVSGPVNMFVGTAAQLTAVVDVTLDADTEVVWTSSDTAVATVSAAGLVTALSDGDATITATSVFDGTKSGSLELTVVNTLRDAKVLYYVDLAIGTDAALAALNAAAASYDTVIVETDSAGFVADLAAEDPDLVVYLRQNGGGLPAAHQPALLDWVDNGGALVFASYDYGNAAVRAQVSAMQAEYTDTENYESMEIQSSVLAAGLTSATIAITNPVGEADNSWGTFSMGLTAIDDGEELAYFYDATPELTTHAALVSGHGGRTMVLGFLSDTVEGDDGARLLRNIFEYVLLAALD